MTFTYKLSRRLALGQLGLATLAAVLAVGCSGGEPTSPNPSGTGMTDPVAAIRIAPKKATIETNQAVRFLGTGFTAAGDSMAISIEWTATGGSITANGVFSAGTTGNFRVIGKGHNKSDTSIVVVVPPQPTLTSISVTPDPANVSEGTTVGFSAAGKLSDGTTAPIGVVWTATGGSIDAGGSYTAGMTAGNYRVVATNTSGTIADTVPVAVAVPQLAKVVLSPSPITLRPGATQQFKAYARTTTGDSIATPVSFSATGGAVTSGGLYSAGQTTGTYRVVATSTTANLADTSVVTIQAPSLAQLIMVPAVASLAAGATLQFQVYGRTTAGDSVAAQVAYTATGGTISSSGLYTAGLSAGSFRVIGTQVGGTMADTSAVTITVSSSATHAGWYVSPSGTSGGSGASSSPWSLAYALGGAAGRIQAGDTVWLRGGTYNAGALNATLHGTSGSPIIVRQYPGEHAAVNGTFSISGSDVWYWGFEQYTNSLTQDIQGFNVQGPRVKLINLTIHDNSGDGIGDWSQSPDGEIVGCVLYNNGYWGSDPGWPNPTSWGHAMYIQNATGTKLIRQNVIYQSFGYGFHLYTVGDHEDNITLYRNVLFANAMKNGTQMIVHSGTYPTTNTTVRGNWFYSTGNNMVWFYGDPGVTLTVDSNRAIGPNGCYRPYNWSSGSLTFRGNLCQGSYSVDGSNDTPSTMTWSGNTWYGNPTNQDWRWNGALYTFSAWNSLTGLGSTDTYVNGSAPAATMVQVSPYETGRGVVSIYNPSGAGSVSADISAITGGGAYCIRHVYAATGSCAVSGTGTSASFPMTGLTPPTPYNGGLGWNGITVPQVTPTFGAFIVSRD